jgi:succinoglycan biosynthesis transport protein ExoP
VGRENVRNKQETTLSRQGAVPLSVVAGGSQATARTLRRQDSLLEIIWRQRRWMILNIALFLALGLLYVTFATRQYTSTSRLIVSKGRPSLLADTHVEPVSEDDNFLSTQREIVASDPVLALALSSPRIHDLRTFSGEKNRLELLKKKLNVEVGKKVDLLYVSYEGKYADEDSQIVSAVVKAYIKYESSQQQAVDDDASTTLSIQRDKWEADLTKKDSELQAFRTSHGIAGSGPDNAPTAQDRLHAVNTALIAAHLETHSARVEYEQIHQQLASNPRLAKRADDPTSADVLGTSPEDMMALKQELAMAKTRERELERQYLPGHPTVQMSIKRVDQLTIDLAAALKMQLAAAEAKEADLQDLYNQEQHNAIEEDASIAEMNRLQADIGRLQSMVDSVDRRNREIGLNSDDSAVTISVLEPAHADDRPTKPQVAASMVLALLAGFGIGALGACVRDKYDRRLNSAQDVSSILGLDVLGRLPSMAAEISPSDRAQQAHLAPESTFAEACRTLRASLLYTARNPAPRTLLIASPNSGDGRSTVASNLAISLAEAGKRVLLVDGDLRSPMQDWIFGLDKVTGLASALRTEDSNDEDHSAGIQYSGVKRLDVLTSGPAVADPVRLLNDRTFGEMLEKLAELYDHVIVDSPAISSGPDSRILAALCDASLLVLLEGQTNQGSAQQSLAALSSVGANVIGVVLNRGAASARNERLSGMMNRLPSVMTPRLASARSSRDRTEQGLAGLVSLPADK